MTMEARAENHLCRIKTQTLFRLDAKYRAGQKEHGGYLPDVGVMALLDAAIDEAIDQVVYLLTMKEQLEGTRRET